MRAIAAESIKNQGLIVIILQLAGALLLKDSLKNEVLRRNPPNKNFKESLLEPNKIGSGSGSIIE
jgi:hypothetical protein